MTDAALYALLAYLLARDALRLYADARRDKRAKTEAESKRQHERLTQGGAG